MLWYVTNYEMLWYGMVWYVNNYELLWYCMGS